MARYAVFSATHTRIKTSVRQLECELNECEVRHLKSTSVRKPLSHSRSIFAALGTPQYNGPQALKTHVSVDFIDLLCN